MEIALVAYVLYASFILVWCSVSGDFLEYIVISPALLELWRLSRSDMILFDLQPESNSETVATDGGDFLPVRPSSLHGLIDWLPPDSTVVFRNHGVSSRCVQQIQQRMAQRYTSRVFWLDEAPGKLSATACSRQADARWRKP